jgi:hypothetical protein
MKKFEFDVLIERTKREKTQTLGELTIYQDRIKPIYDCKTLELEEDKNAKRDDCIPVGIYEVVKRHSAKYGFHFHILGVENRSFILIHAANYSRQLLGCVAVGKKHIDIDKDGLKDVTSSQATIKELNKLLPKKFTLKII